MANIAVMEGARFGELGSLTRGWGGGIGVKAFEDAGRGVGVFNRVLDVVVSRRWRKGEVVVLECLAVARRIGRGTTSRL